MSVDHDDPPHPHDPPAAVRVRIVVIATAQDYWHGIASSGSAERPRVDRVSLAGYLPAGPSYLSESGSNPRPPSSLVRGVRCVTGGSGPLRVLDQVHRGLM
jgi:hypothetical protein